MNYGVYGYVLAGPRILQPEALAAAKDMLTTWRDEFRVLDTLSRQDDYLFDRMRIHEDGGYAVRELLRSTRVDRTHVVDQFAGHWHGAAGVEENPCTIRNAVSVEGKTLLAVVAHYESHGEDWQAPFYLLVRAFDALGLLSVLEVG